MKQQPDGPVVLKTWQPSVSRTGKALGTYKVPRAAAYAARALAQCGLCVHFQAGGVERLYTPQLADRAMPYRLRCPGCRRFRRYPVKAAPLCRQCTPQNAGQREGLVKARRRQRELIEQAKAEYEFFFAQHQG